MGVDWERSTPAVAQHLAEWERAGVVEFPTSRWKALAVVAVLLWATSMTVYVAIADWDETDPVLTAILLGVAVLGAFPGGLFVVMALRPRWRGVRVTVEGIDMVGLHMGWSEIEEVRVFHAPNRRSPLLRLTPAAYWRIARQKRWPRWFAKVNAKTAGESIVVPALLTASTDTVLVFLQIVHSRQAGRSGVRID